MDQPGDVTFYLDPGLLQSARDGRHNFIALVAKTVSDARLRVFFEANSDAARRASERRPGYALFHMDDPTHPRALTMRRSYFYPFWQIETSARRWEWKVALTPFKPEEVDAVEAQKFFGFWRKRLFPDASDTPAPHGPIYIPLQGLVRQHRSFQSCSPVEMIARTAERFPDSDVIVTLHPNESYEAADHKALETLGKAYPNVNVSRRDMVTCLNACEMVVTQNSSVALAGFFFRKPAVLFAQVDFHHIAGNVPRDGEDKAFAARRNSGGFESYIWWFLQEMSINAGRPQEEVTTKIRGVLRRHGWPV
ncbi:hypothetical protein ACOI1H_00740 [Loktanella sp. DJP18]|uniref:hypothetical protein n=1 Tax=Loktanella sp. DJP18 TaxID=3409788 RepID=UPI003BB6000C